MDEIVLKNNFFEFKSKIKRQVSGTAVGTKFAPPYSVRKKLETSLLEKQQLQPLVYFIYIDDIFLMCKHGEEEVNIFLESTNEFDLCIKSNKESIPFLDIEESFRSDKAFTNVCVKPSDHH